VKSKIKSLATKTPKPKKPTSKAAYVLAVKIMAEMDVTERF
jgi:hypothetical protein